MKKIPLMTPFLLGSHFRMHPIRLLLEMLGVLMRGPSPQIKSCPTVPPKSPPMPASLSGLNPLPTQFCLDMSLRISWFLRLCFCGRCRNLDITIWLRLWLVLVKF